MSSNALARVNNRGVAAPREPTAWSEMLGQAHVLVKSGFLPDSIKTAEQAVAIMLTGEELGIPKMLALRSINVIKGKPTLSADLMAGLVQREIDRHGDGEFTVMPPTATECTIVFRRWNEQGVRHCVYTMEDAKRSGLATSNQNYQRHPAAMLRARATSTAARMGFPDVIAGLYAPEEMETDERPEFRVLPIEHGLDTNAEDLPERQVGASEGVTPEADHWLWKESDKDESVDGKTGEILADIGSVKREIQSLVKEAEYSDEDLKHVAVDLGIEHGWRDLTVDEAIAIRDDIRQRMKDEDAKRAGAVDVDWEEVTED